MQSILFWQECLSVMQLEMASGTASREIARRGGARNREGRRSDASGDDVGLF
jgi:hypothetical protein